MPERVAQTDAYTQLSEVDGSGPFKFVKDQWQPGHKAVYVRNPLRPAISRCPACKLQHSVTPAHRSGHWPRRDALGQDREMGT